jgi:hypothetical protein
MRYEPSYKQLEVNTNRKYLHVSIVTDITTWNSERKDTYRTTHKTKKMSNTHPTKKLGVNSGAREG